MRGRVRETFREFLQLESSGGIVLLICAAIALIAANSPWSHAYLEIWHAEIPIGFGRFSLTELAHVWINDGLMAIFFLVVGLEIKRELLVGELSSRSRAMLPVFAALGGMIVPALIYLAVQQGGQGTRGWGIPMATDIAFSLGLLALLGTRVPVGLKMFLAALAIVDDIGAILVIAIFYSSHISWLALGSGLAVAAVCALLNRAGIRSVWPYLALGLVMWYAFLQSGVHPTVSGVLLALCIPFSPDQSEEASPGEGLIEFLHPWQTYVIMPLFALANAAIALNAQALSHLSEPVPLGVILGLVIGKPLGIVLFSYAAIKFKLGSMPMNARYVQILGIGLLGGIGFTMSLFIADLALEFPPLLESAKLGIVIGSTVSAILGLIVLSASAKRRPIPTVDESGN